MQLTQALNLVPPREKPQPLFKHSGLLALEDIQARLNSAVRDVELMTFELPKLMSFIKNKSAADAEIKYAMKGVLNDLEADALADIENEKGEAATNTILDTAKEIVGKVFHFGSFLIWRFIRRVIKWGIKTLVKTVFRAALRVFVRPIITAILGFLTTPIGLVAAAILGGVGLAGYFIYRKWFKKESLPEDKRVTDEDEDSLTSAIGRFLGRETTVEMPMAGAAPVAIQQTGVAASSLADLLQKGESAGKDPYNTVNRPNANNGKGAAGIEPLTQMTVAQVRQAQAAGKFNAAGRYQIISTTLDGAIRALNLQGNELFDKNLQDKIFSEYLIGPKKRPNLAAYLSGKSDNVYAAAQDAAMEWASVASPAGYKTRDGTISDGTISYYSGSRNNPSHAHISAATMIATLQQERARRLGMTVTETAPAPMKEGIVTQAVTPQNQQKEAALTNTTIGIPTGKSQDRLFTKDSRGRLYAMSV